MRVCDLASDDNGRKVIASTAALKRVGELFSSEMPRGSPTKSHPVLGPQCHWAMCTPDIAICQSGLEKILPAQTTTESQLESQSNNPSLTNDPTSDIFVDHDQAVRETPRQVDTTVSAQQIDAALGVNFACMGDHNPQSISNILKSYTYIKNAAWDKATKPLPSIPDQSVTVDDADVLECRFPYEYLSDSLVRNKINYFNYWKSDVEFEVKVNNAPTQQGCLYLWYEPMRGADFPVTTPISYRAGLAQQTSYPGAYLNLETTDTATLKIPFLWYQEYFDLTAPDEMGRFHVSVVAPLDGDSSATSVEVLLNIKCINPDIRVPTTRECAFPYAEGVVHMGPEEPQDGKITRLMKGVGQVADVVAGFPALAPVAKSVSWMSRLVGNVSSALGFSKPLSVQETKPIMRYPGFGLQQVEGVVPGLSFGAIQDNEICHQRPGPDEMSFDYICARPVLVKSSQISLSAFNTKGDTWLAMKTHPIPDDITYSLDGDHDTVSGGPMQCLATQFDKWRGTLVYDFELIKTKFHKGRLQVSWIPSQISDPGAININKAYTKIWDVGVSSTFQFKVPFVLPYAYANVAKNRKFGRSILTIPGYTGIIVIKVFNKFNYPDTVPANLTLLTKLSGEDMDFQVPMMLGVVAKQDQLLPVSSGEEQETTDATDPDHEFDHSNPIEIEAEEAEVHMAYEDNFSVPFVNDRVGGEKISSMRQLLKKQAKHTGNYWFQCNTTALLSMYAFYAGPFQTTILGHSPNAEAVYNLRDTERGVEILSSRSYPFLLSTDGCTQVKVPFYSNFPCLPTTSTYYRPMSVGPSGSLVGIGDDFNAWYLIAPPTMVVPII